MEGIGIIVIGFLMSAALGLLCFLSKSLRQFTLAALVSPFATSIAFLLGAFVLADMNPGREYGSAYIPKGTEHNPVALNYFEWLIAVLTTATLSATLSYLLQKGAVKLLQTKGPPENLLNTPDQTSD